MKISKNLERIISQQIANEYQSAYIYLGMAAYFEGTSFGGFAHWMRAQAAEEVEHGTKFFSYLASREGAIELHAIEKVRTIFASPSEPFAVAHAHEQRVTRWIHDIYELAILEKDYETQEFLHWFLKEQVEEEQKARDMAERLRIAEQNPMALLSLDAGAAQRGRD
ncbi:MAG: ferritin [Puniceicoccales bacterium]|jgi:ferritin|nr:ferritin [Puniceicoccales bacterium]